MTETGRASIKKVVTRQISLFVIVTMVLILFGVAVMMTAALKKELRQSMDAEARHIEDMLESYLEFQKENAASLAANQFVVNSLVDSSGRSRYLPKIIADFSGTRSVTAVAIVDFEGKVIYSIGAPARDYLKTISLLPTLERGRPALQIAPDRRHLLFVEPIMFYRTPQGAVITEVGLDAIAGPFVNPRRHFQYRLLHQGTVIWDRPGQGGAYLTSLYPLSPGKRLLAGLDLDLEIGTPRSSYYRLVAKVIAELAILGIIFILFSVLLARRIADGIVHPILTLRERVRNADLFREPSGASFRTNNELEDLAEAFAERNRRLREEMAERQRAENALLFTQYAVDHAADSVFWIREDSTIAYANLAACRKLGYDQSELMSLSVKDVDPNFPAAIWPAHWKHVREREYLVIETLHRTKQGALIPVELSINYMSYKGEEYNCVFARDISDRVRSQEERGMLENQLRQAQKLEAIGTLAGGIAHDFNNILSPIMGYTEMTRMLLPGSPKAQEYLEEVLKASNRAKELVQQILTFSRRTERGLEPLQMQLVVREALKLLRSTLPTSIEIREDIDNECGAVMADPTQIHQLIMNLGTNAYHAMRDGGGVLGVSLHEAEIGREDYVPGLDLAPGSYLKLEVSDTGTGMTPEVREKIFDPYFTTKGKDEGTGLGLSIVHGIVKSCSGRITVYSEPGQGSTFRIYIPRIPAGTEPPHAGLQDGMLTGTERVLVVDDEESIARVVQLMLSSLGYQVDTALGGREALELLRGRPEGYAVVITDMTMPGMSGVELAKRIWDIKQDIPIILCSGFSEMANEEKAKALGFSRFMMKPITHAALARAVRETIDRQKVREA